MSEFSFEELQRRRIANIQSQFVNVEEIQKAEDDDDVEKARHGTYTDTAENRRLNRVGQEYGHKAEEKQPSGQRTKKTEEASGDGGKTVAEHAANTDSKVLQKVVDDPNAKPELKEAAQAELKKRGEGSKEKEEEKEEKGNQNSKIDKKHQKKFDEIKELISRSVARYDNVGSIGQSRAYSLKPDIPTIVSDLFRILPSDTIDDFNEIINDCGGDVVSKELCGGNISKKLSTEIVRQFSFGRSKREEMKRNFVDDILNRKDEIVDDIVSLMNGKEKIPDSLVNKMKDIYIYSEGRGKVGVGFTIKDFDGEKHYLSFKTDVDKFPYLPTGYYGVGLDSVIKNKGTNKVYSPEEFEWFGHPRSEIKKKK